VTSKQNETEEWENYMAITLDRVGVVGCGLMGSGIAEVCARAGLDVTVAELDDAALAVGRRRIEHSLGRAVTAGKLTGIQREQAFERITFATDIGDLYDRQLVVEAVSEDAALKLQVFEQIDKVTALSDVVLASNTSSIPIMKLAMATTRPECVVGIHFFNPVPVLRLVELVPSLLTSDRTVARAERFAVESLGKHVICSKDRAGFVVNALLLPFLLSAVRMVESGFASAEDIDAGMIEGCAHPMGPLALCDLIGLDTVVAVAQSLYEEFKEPLYAPPPLLSRMVDAGLMGKKTARGFFNYAQ
jgi:3-hydroxybutyryl-CoA dehydrogenase